MGLSKGQVSKLVKRLIQENKVQKKGRIYEVIDLEKDGNEAKSSETKI